MIYSNKIMIIDSHVHFGNALGFNAPCEMVLKSMEKYSIDKAIVSNLQSTECDHYCKVLPEENQVLQIESLKKTVEFARNNKGKIFAALWCKPLLEKPDLDFVQLIEENLDVVKALKFHPYHSSVCFNDYRIQAFLDVAKNFHLPVITHTGSGGYDNCDLVYEVAKKYPEINFIMAHLGLETDNIHAISLCAKQKNLFGDTAWVPIKNVIKFIEKCGSEKILFGTDNPIDGKDTYSQNKKGEPSIYLDYFKNSEKISSSDYENLMGKNALRVFNL